MLDERFGGFWRRFWAFAIDQFLLYLLSLIVQGIGLFAFGLSMLPRYRTELWGSDPGGLAPYVLLSWGFLLSLSAVYFTWFHGLFGQTPGKLILGLKVIQASGEPMTLGVAFLRWVGSIISQLVLCLGYLWVAFDHRKQGWHDKIAATVVIRTGNSRSVRVDRSVTPPPPAVPPTMTAPERSWDTLPSP